MFHSLTLLPQTVFAHSTDINFQGPDLTGFGFQPIPRQQCNSSSDSLDGLSNNLDIPLTMFFPVQISFDFVAARNGNKMDAFEADPPLGP